MIVLSNDEYPQGGPEWRGARCGLPTSSRFKHIVTTTGKLSKSETSRGYMCELIAERLTGDPQDDLSSDWMERGIEMEPKAIAYYEYTTGLNVERVGMCLADDRSVGCSPDGLVVDGYDQYVKGLEIKCPAAKTHLMYLLQDAAYYKHQVQGSMWVTGLPEWDFLSYYPGLPPVLRTFQRDEEFIEKLAAAVKIFCGDLESAMERLPKGFKVESKANIGRELREAVTG